MYTYIHKYVYINNIIINIKNNLQFDMFVQTCMGILDVCSKHFNMYTKRVKSKSTIMKPS